MLSDQELQALFDELETPEPGRRLIRWIRSNAPTRSVDGRSMSNPVRYCSRKMGFVLECEAYHTEYAAAVTWDFDDETLEMYSQPVQLQLSNRLPNGRRSNYKYTPDFFRITRTGFEFIECKLEEELLKLTKDKPYVYAVDPNGCWRRASAEQAVLPLGTTFKVRSSSENQWALIENIEFLRDYFVWDRENNVEEQQSLRGYASAFTSSLEKLTMQSRLSECSFVLWEGLLEYHSQGLLHAHPRWCPICFQEWRSQGVAPYFALVWQAAQVRHCPLHDTLLSDHCPSCEKAQPFVPRHSFLDHCSYCGDCLAKTAGGRTERVHDSDVSPAERHAIHAIGEMITVGPSIRQLLNIEHFWSRVQEAADTYYGGQIKTLERAIGFPESSIRGWKAGRHRPSFSALYKLTMRLGVTPVFFLEHGLSRSFTPPVAPQRPKRTYKKKLPSREMDDLCLALNRVIETGYSELPMRDVANQLGYRHSFLMYWFRDECRQISQLHREWVATRAEQRSSVARELTTSIVRQMYEGPLRVTRRSIGDALIKAGLSLQDPVVRSAVYATRSEHFSRIKANAYSKR